MSRLRVFLSLAALLSAYEVRAAVNVITACQPLISGVYLLNADVTAPANGPCFTMAADNITLNLGGHTVTGSLGVAAITDGGVSRRGISLASGTLYVDIGVDLFASTEVRIESLTVDTAKGPGIATGPYSKLLANLVVSAGQVTLIKVQCPSLLVWNNTFMGPNAIVELGKGCKDVENVVTKK